MKGAVIIICGYQGAGKSLLTKEFIKPVHPKRLRILDINAEYVEKYPDSVVAIRSGEFKGEPDFEQFEYEMIHAKETVFVGEDATVVFSHRGYNKELVRAIIKKRHSKNIYLLLFHSLRVVPRDVFEYADELWLLKTADTDDTIAMKYRGTGVQELVNEVRLLEDYHWSERQQVPIRDRHYKVLKIKKGQLDKNKTDNEQQEQEG